MSKGYVEAVFSQYIKGTPNGAIVRDMTIKLCTLTNEVRRAVHFPTANVHITTKVIKKHYDKRTAEENDFILKHGWRILHMPDEIYRNKDGKRGDYLFAKNINNSLYVASVEVSTYADEPILYTVSIFRVRKLSYLGGYELIWSWKGGAPSS